MSRAQRVDGPRWRARELDTHSVSVATAGWRLRAIAEDRYIKGVVTKVTQKVWQRDIVVYLKAGKHFAFGYSYTVRGPLVGRAVPFNGLVTHPDTYRYVRFS